MNPITAFLSIAVAAIICLLAIPTLCRFAPRWGLTDQPTARKQHDGAIPTIGGVAIFVALLVTTLLLWPKQLQLSLLGISAVLLVLGVVDDRYSLSPLQRLPFQILATLTMIFLTGLQISSVGNLYGAGAVQLSGAASVLFTIICTVGVINSINMIDGIDGLSGTILGISFCALAFISWQAGLDETLMFCLAILGSLLAFLFYNSRVFRSKPTTFLGDSGSMVLGFLLLALFIKVTQGNATPLSAISAGWIFGLPLMDTVSVMVGRIIAGNSPFAAGRDHLHHQLLDAGQSVNDTVKAMALLHFIFVMIGLIGNQLRHLEPLLFWLFVLLVLCHFFLTPKILANHSTSAS